jgi:hypothetical protein
MKPRLFLVSLVVGAVSLSTAPAGEQPEPSLPDSCKRMLEMQTAVAASTRSLDKRIQATDDRKPRPEDRQAARKLADRQMSIVAEAMRFIDTVEGQGSARAFSAAVRDMREDMKRVQRRLAAGDVGPGTQAIQDDIIDMLKDMDASLKPWGCRKGAVRGQGE